MFIGGIVAAAVVIGALATALLTRRVAHDDVHSVEGYHRSLHTLESINGHPAIANPQSAVRRGGTSTVRVTDGRLAPPPPAPAPASELPVLDADSPLRFDDARPSPVEPTPAGTKHRDKAMGSINHRPRRLAAPAMAVAAVLVLVVVLVVTGSHAAPPARHHHGASTHGRAATSPGGSPQKSTTRTTSTTTPPPVSPPRSSSAGGATYDVSVAAFTMDLSATAGACWVDATGATGATLYAGTLTAGVHRSFDATGPVTVVVGAPSVFAASVDGTEVLLPSGYRTPFTLRFVPAATPSS